MKRQPNVKTPAWAARSATGYRSSSGRDGDACKLSIASNVSYNSLYCFAADAKGLRRPAIRRPAPEAHQGDCDDGLLRLGLRWRSR
jgi:hypothetical protein